jgi:phage baseplate assembly protein W
LTSRGESFYNQLKGSRLNSLLFENIDEVTGAAIEDEIREVITNYEPRVELISVKSSPDYDNYGYNLSIVYSVIGTDAQPRVLNFALNSVR